MQRQQILFDKIREVRNQTETICAPLAIEDYVPQPMPDVSPPKWHLAHSTWFFEQFFLLPYFPEYRVYDEMYSYLFNSYYEHVGERLIRPHRGLMTRPTVAEVFAYRAYVSRAIEQCRELQLESPALDTLELGIHHEQQHQELLVYDIKYILGNQPTFPIYGPDYKPREITTPQRFIRVSEGIAEIGHEGEGFCFDNECGRHKVFLNSYEISDSLVTNGEFADFIEDGGYSQHSLWLSDGWALVKSGALAAPLYWYRRDDEWWTYSLAGLERLERSCPVHHLSFYEASAFAEWRGCRLPTEFEWERASSQFSWGEVWEWTYSAYHPYPNFHRAEGALGEYNGKFMCNQYVLRGASVATPTGHSRATYRNFFPAHSRWMYSGVRLARE